MKKYIALIFVFSFILASCSQRIVDYTLISTKNFDVTRMKEYKVTTQRVTEEEKVHIILFFPTKLYSGHGQMLKQAIDNAISSIPGCVALSNGVITSKFMWLLLYGYSSIEVEGDAIIDPRIAVLSQDNSQSNYYKVYMNDDLSVESVDKINEMEYNIIKSGE